MSKLNLNPFCCLFCPEIDICFILLNNLDRKMVILFRNSLCIHIGLCKLVDFREALTKIMFYDCSYIMSGKSSSGLLPNFSLKTAILPKKAIHVQTSRAMTHNECGCGNRYRHCPCSEYAACVNISKVL